jgi:hypothetical protein
MPKFWRPLRYVRDSFFRFLFLGGREVFVDRLPEVRCRMVRLRWSETSVVLYLYLIVYWLQKVDDQPGGCLSEVQPASGELDATTLGGQLEAYIR